MMILNLFFQVSLNTLMRYFYCKKSKTNRIDTLTKYIFSSLISFFSDDTENFIVLATFANKKQQKKDMPLLNE